MKRVRAVWVFWILCAVVGAAVAAIRASFVPWIGDDLPLALGIPAHRIPAIFTPRFVRATSATLAPDAPVVGIVLNGDARAYPLHLLNQHEVVNDVVGGVPVLVARCTECRSTQVYRRTIADGAARTFGVSGDMLDGAQVLYDCETRTLWRHRDGLAVRGRHKGAWLRQDFPAGSVAKTVRWGLWRVRYARTLLLSGDAADISGKGSVADTLSGDR